MLARTRGDCADDQTGSERENPPAGEGPYQTIREVVRGAVPNAPGGYGLYTDDDVWAAGAVDSNGQHRLTVAGTRVGRLEGKNGAFAGAMIFGHEANTGAGVKGATISGGGYDGSPNIVHDRAGTVGGGAGNVAGHSDGATYGIFATVGGGVDNEALQEKATVAGGSTNRASAKYSTVGGGAGVQATAQYATASGGRNNYAEGYGAAIAGGESAVASNNYASVGGGYNNEASGDRATIGGGGSNLASATGAAIPGGEDNEASGRDSLAAGSNAKAADDNAFVWADGTTDSNLSPVTFSSASGSGPTGADTFHVRATGGTRLVSGANSDGVPTTGVTLAAGDGTWSSLRSAAAKTNVRPVDSERVLDAVVDTPISRWEYDSDGDAEHVGPMAEDFHEAFGLGADPDRIATVDADGVALAAIQGLAEKLDDRAETMADQADKIERLESENVALRDRFSSIEDRLAADQGDGTEA